jgi:hypothetical protein
MVACVWRVVSGVWLGVGLLLALAVAYGTLTLVEQFWSGPKSILPAVGSIYAHWTVLTLTFAACGNLVFATVRIPVRWDRAGAWCSHLGLMFLALGSIVFWQTRTEGQCFISRERNGGWPTMRHFFQSTDEVACHVYDTTMMQSASPLPPTVQTVFDSPTGMEPVDIDVDIVVPASVAPEGVSIKATRIYPRAELRQQWLDDAPRITPAVEIQFSHGQETARTIMCQSYEETYRLDLHECIVVFQASEAMSQEEIDRRNAAIAPTTQPSRQFFVIHYTGRGQPVLIVGSASGKLHRRPFLPGQSISPAQAEHPTRITLIRTLDHARRGINLEVAPETVPDRRPEAAIELTIRSGSWKADRVVPYGAYLTGRPTTILLPSGRSIYVAFSHRWQELPEPIRITRHEFKTAPASRMPEDYICDLEIGSGIHVRRETLKLNLPVSVGRYRLHQSTWQPKEGTSDYTDPSAIILGVADRPGIWLIFVGSIAVCLGFPYAFYVKPLILKSRAGGAS